MSDTMYKMAGLFCILISIFILLGAMFLTGDVVSTLVNRLCWVVGLLLLASGVVLYKIVKNEK